MRNGIDFEGTINQFIITIQAIEPKSKALTDILNAAMKLRSVGLSDISNGRVTERAVMGHLKKMFKQLAKKLEE